MEETISVYYSQDKYWAYTESDLKKIGTLLLNMDFVFAIKRDENEIQS